MKKRVLLMTAPYHTGIIEVTGTWPPLSLVYIAGHLRAAGHEVAIYDVMSLYHDLRQIEQKIREFKPDVVMIGAFTCSVNAAIDSLRVVKKVNQQIITCLGGVHATFCHEEILQANHGVIDFIIRGEGELTAVELLNNLDQPYFYKDINGIAYHDRSKVIVTPDRAEIADLDTLIPAWDLVDWTLYRYSVTGRRLGLVSSSRGCNHSCAFCSQHLFWKGSYRQRSAESIVAEIELLNKAYGVGMFMFSDEYSTRDQQRWEAILDLLIEKNLDIHFSMETRADAIIRDQEILHKYRKAGFIHIYVGVESVQDDVLERYGKEVTTDQGKLAIKLLNDADILTECSFIMGGPEETPDSMDRTLKIAMEYNPDLAHFLLITPWPYTPVYQEFREHIIEPDLSKYHFVHPIVKPVAMSKEQLWDKLIDCFRQFYMNKAKEYIQAPDSFKKRYMIRSIQIMHQEFFVHNFGTQTVKMPEAMGIAINQALHGVRNYESSEVTDMLRWNADKGRMNMEQSRVSQTQLDQEIMEFINEGVHSKNEDKFNMLALKEFNFQYQANQEYQKFCVQKGIYPESVSHWSQIPAISTQAFKQAVIASFPLEETELALLTSGTTNPNMRGKIYRDKDSLDMILRSNYLLTKEYLFPDLERIRILLLVPSPKVAPAMAMAFGLEQVKKEFGTEDSLYLITPNGFESDTLIEALQHSETTDEPVALIGATSGFVFFFNQCRQRGLKFSLPKGSRVCDGGGYQGTFGECSRDEYYALVEDFLGIPAQMCINTLGMSESGTNYFDNTVKNYLDGNPAQERYKRDLPWTRTIAVGPRTGQRLPKGEIGLLRHYDLTNRATVIAVQTENLGYETEDGFEIIGRAGANLGGLGMVPTSVKDWILAGTKSQQDALATGVPEGAGNPHGMMGGNPHGMMGGNPHGMMGGNPHGMMGGNPHGMMGGNPHGMMGGNPHGMMGNPEGGCSHKTAEIIAGAHGITCSTVADKMMQGNPCSTVADAMLIKAHGNNCSTVADKMMQGNPCSTVADAMLVKAHGNNCSTVADKMMQGNPCSTVADDLMNK